MKNFERLFIRNLSGSKKIELNHEIFIYNNCFCGVKFFTLIDTAGRSGTFKSDRASEITNDL